MGRWRNYLAFYFVYLPYIRTFAAVIRGALLVGWAENIPLVIRTG